VAEAPEEFRRRSPARNAEMLLTPLLLHANTNDEDVKLVAVQNLIAALQAPGKDFQFRICTNAPGGHMFNRLDTPPGRRIARRDLEVSRKVPATQVIVLKTGENKAIQRVAGVGVWREPT
jgi:dienelactone hydrolase